MAPCVSVLITAYQAERDIAPCLHSVLRQTMTDYEVVVVDDGCTDRTAQIVAEMARRDRRIKLLSLYSNRGPGGGRNAGLALCRGVWVALLDSDDAFEPTRLELLLQWAEAHGADMVADNLTLISYPDGRALGPAFERRQLPADGRITTASYMRSNDFSAGRFSYGYLKPMIRRSLIERRGISFHEDLMVCEDFHFHLDCLLAGAVWSVTPQPLYRYAQRTDSLARRVDAAKLDAVLVHSRRLLTDRRLDDEVRWLAARRHRQITRLQAYLGFRQDMRCLRLLTAAGRTLRRPDLLLPGVETLWRRSVTQFLPSRPVDVPLEKEGPPSFDGGP